MICLAIFAAETTSRVEDFFRYGTPFWAAPDFDRDLFMTGPNGERQGRPNGKYKHFRINGLGFRGPEVEPEPAADVPRILLLGASETFGMYESPDQEYAAQLRKLLEEAGRYEVVNSAVPGMALSAMHSAFDNRLKRLKPNIVIIYPNPLFDLNISLAASHSENRKQGLAKSAPIASTTFQFRLIERLKDSIDKPDFWQRRIDAQKLSEKRNALGPAAVFDEMPDEYVKRFIAELDSLIRSIQQAGATPILMTHAINSKDPPTAADLLALEGSLVHTPRATPMIILRYESAIRSETLKLASTRQVQVIDLAAIANGKPEYFGDLVHFTNKGAYVAACKIAEKILDTEKQ